MSQSTIEPIDVRDYIDDGYADGETPVAVLMETSREDSSEPAPAGRSSRWKEGGKSSLGFIAEDVDIVSSSAANQLDLSFSDISDEDEDVANRRDKPGKIINVNNLGGGVEGKPGYADFTGESGRSFTPLMLTLPSLPMRAGECATAPDTLLERSSSGRSR